jgi:hypothetical protein
MLLTLSDIDCLHSEEKAIQQKKSVNQIRVCPCRISIPKYRKFQKEETDAKTIH